MPSVAHTIAALAFALLAVQPSGAQDLCADGPVTPTHRIETSVPPSSGTARPAMILASLEPTVTPATVNVVLEGVILPARDGQAARAIYSDVMADLRGKVVALAAVDGLDRRGRLHGTLRLEDGVSVGERLLAAGAGLADVSFAPCAARFLAAEAKARTEKRGIWRQSRIWTDLNAAAAGLPDFVLGRGKVASVGRSGRTTYINFGGNYRTDATVRLREALASALTAAGQPPESLAGRMIEVRGWATRRNGLDLELTTPLALRLADGVSDKGTD